MSFSSRQIAAMSPEARLSDRDLALATRRRLPIGAECVPGLGVSFRVWAPRATSVQVVITDDASSPAHEMLLAREPTGYWAGEVPGAGPGIRYGFRLDGRGPFPDPASRFQPEGPHGPSEVIDPGGFSWTDNAWHGIELAGQVLYEIHVGTFTPEGTWVAAARELPALASTGITVVEVMPIAEFPGRFGWGYDGVSLFAPTRLYGRPDDLRRFVDRAHALRLGVILDVVYNHVGPDGNYLREFAREYFTDRYPNEWADALNFDGPGSRSVREFFVANAGYWIEEFHLDGLRLDATQQMFDASAEHVLGAIGRRARVAARQRSIILVAENESQHVQLVRPPADGGYGLDGLWNDDFHHAAHVALTGRSEAYYSDYTGSPQELVAAVETSFLYQGQRSAWQQQPRGTSTAGVASSAFVTYLENHDQIANSAAGERLHQLTSPGCYRALTAVLLLGPGTPMLFQGQEFAASTPFLFFADHVGDLARSVREGRRKFLGQFPSLVAPEMQRALPDPADPATFERSKLAPGERHSHIAALALHRDLLRLRREDGVFGSHAGVRGSVLGPEAFAVRWAGDGGDERLLLVNLGRDLLLRPVSLPLLAPPGGRCWRLLWSSEDPRYGGGGVAPVETEDGWLVPGQAAVALVAEPGERA
jgi:maltooligosyltrehalose trehalohydrolase